MAISTSSQVSDDFVQPFLRQGFDPASYLNTTLPALATSSYAASSAAKTGSVALSELSSQTQSLLSQLNAHTSRLTAVLTQLTDDILRTGGRLAYQVEILRGETLGLSETLTEGLHVDIAKLAPPGAKPLVNGETSSQNYVEGTASPQHGLKPGESSNKMNSAKATARTSQLDQLRTLTQVRERLENVIKVFGEAMQWTIPPSEVSLTSSLISVSAPNPEADNQSREEKGREHADRLRREIADLVVGTGQGKDGHSAAMERIEALRELAQIWKGTSEEKPRIKFLDSLVKLADEKAKASQKEAEADRQRQARGPSPRRPAVGARQTGNEKAYSILDRLYLD